MSALLALAERADDVRQCRERLVDIDGLLQAVFVLSCSRACKALRAGKVNWASASQLLFHSERLPRLSMASHFSSVRGFVPRTLSVKTEWDRDERSFMSVAATARRDRARSSKVDT